MISATQRIQTIITLVFCSIQILVRITPFCFGILGKDCKIVNNTICLTTTSFVIRVVVGGWKESLVLSIPIREPQE